MAKRRSRRVNAVIGVLVVLVLAAAAGTIFYLDYHQAHTNAKADKAAAARVRAAVGIQLRGTVTAVTPGAVTIRLPGGRVRRVFTNPRARIYTTMPAGPTIVTRGRRAVLRFEAGSAGIAHEVLVLPIGSRLGQPIFGTRAGDVWLLTPAGRRGAKVKISGAPVEVATPARLAAVTVGAKVILRVQNTVTKPVRSFVTDIVVLPSGTGFVT